MTDVSGPPILLRRAALLAEGFSDNHIRRALRDGTLTTISPGVYVRAPDAQALSPAARHRVAVDALMPKLAGDPVVSHVSAAILHGLPFVYSEMPPVHITRAGGQKSRRGPGLLAHRATLRPAEIMTVAGLAVTTVARTVVDCALQLPFDNAVVLADAALHRRMVTRSALVEQLGSHLRVPGVRAAAAVVAFADPRSAGPGESCSRAVLHRAGLPAPDLRMPVCDGAGRPLGPAGFGYRRQRVLGEFDGDEPFSPQAIARDERLRDAGWQVLRWTWRDLYPATGLITGIAAALGIPVPTAPPLLLRGNDPHLGGV